jgi:hypothetical protein
MNALAAEHGRLSGELAALDTVLGMFRTDLVPDAIPALRIVSQPTWAKRGEVTRAVLAILRKANAPLSTDEIAARIAQQRGEADCVRIRKTVYKALDQRRLRGQAISSRGPRGLLLWALAR